MLAKESYGFNTFLGLRVAEIQQKTLVTDWSHIPSKQNISDILIKGVPPNMLGSASDWQNGPEWLCRDESEWPVSSPSILSTSGMEQYLRKSTVCTARSSILEGLDLLASRCSNLQRLLRVVAYLMRWCYSTSLGLVKKNIAMNSCGRPRPISASEKQDALWVIVTWEQRERLSLKQVQKLVPIVIKKKLVNFKLEVSLTVVGSRVKNFPLAFSGQSEEIPILPDGHLARGEYFTLFPNILFGKSFHFFKLLGRVSQSLLELLVILW